MDHKLVKIPQLTAARCKFDGLLQQIAERMDSQSGDEMAYDDDSKSSIRNGKKPYVKPSKKKKEPQSTSSTVITKVLDCSVDLAQFNEYSSLYSMVRAWTKNNSFVGDSSESESEEEDEDPRVVTVIPPPLPRPEDHSRIPSPLPPTGEEFIMASEGNNLPDMNDILMAHKQRWKTVRQKWREASVNNEARYYESCELLAKCQAVDPSPQHEWDGIEPM